MSSVARGTEVASRDQPAGPAQPPTTGAYSVFGSPGSVQSDVP